jgi:hypothetical protein
MHEFMLFVVVRMQAATNDSFDAVITLGNGDTSEQLAPVRQALLDRLVRVKDKVARHSI